MTNNRSDTTVPFLCPRLTATEIELTALGIIIMEPSGRISGAGGAVVIGALIVAGGLIYAQPRLGVGRQQLSALFGAAEMAIYSQPRTSEGWRFVSDGGVPRWVSWVTAREEAVSAEVLVASEVSHPGRRDRRDVA